MIHRTFSMHFFGARNVWHPNSFIARVWSVGLLSVPRYSCLFILHASRARVVCTAPGPWGSWGCCSLSEEEAPSSNGTNKPQIQLQVKKLCLCFIRVSWGWGQRGGLVAPEGLASKPPILTSPGGLGDGSV